MGTEQAMLPMWRSVCQQPCTIRGRFLGCLLGGAVGDALGAPVEFMSREEIIIRFGPKGITRYASAYGGLGTITDDTQMTLFTAEGLLRGYVRLASRGICNVTSVVAGAYLRWLQTQQERPGDQFDDIDGIYSGWLFQQALLHERRAPGNTCLSALHALKTIKSRVIPAKNNSKGCGGVMRMAPLGLMAWSAKGYNVQRIFDMGIELAALTHGHPTGQLASGVFPVLILALVDGASLREGLITAKALLKQKAQYEETLCAIEAAEKLADSLLPPHEAIAKLGQGWIAEEALAISIYCALVGRSFREGVLLAVNHDGDSDSTGSITGNLLGAAHGVKAIPNAWLDSLELREVITEIAEDLYDYREWDIGEYSKNWEQKERVWQKYPGV